MKYFAYGSNMSTPRLRERVPSCEFVTTAKLLGHQLRFHKRSNDKSSKCDAFHSGVDTDIIWGAVFNISAAEKKSVDRAEGLGSGYNETTVDLITPAGEHLRAITYNADNTAIAEGLSPYTWYKDLVLNGAAEHGLPADYIAASIEAVTATKDPDASRDKRGAADQPSVRQGSLIGGQYQVVGDDRQLMDEPLRKGSNRSLKVTAARLQIASSAPDLIDIIH